MANGTRYSATTKQYIDLKFQFLRNDEAFNAFKINKVEIYPSLIDAKNNTNKISIIDGSYVIKSTAGLYQYTVYPLEFKNLYFDKIYLVPDEGYAEISFINNFYVYDKIENVDGLPSSILPKCKITGYVINSESIPLEGVIIRIEPLNEINGINNFSVLSSYIEVITNNLGYWEKNLIKSLENNKVIYKFTFYYKGFIETIIKTMPINESIMNFNIVLN